MENEKIDWWAEDIFKTRCSRKGVIATKPDRDHHGWDYVLSFPHVLEDQESETQPSRRKAYVQIKSTAANRLRCDVKVSNMREACASPDPWFIFMITDDERVYAKHVAGILVADGLKAARKARLERKPFQSVSVEIKFREGDLISAADIVQWMRDHMGASSEDYSASKSRHFRCAGYEDGVGEGHFSFTEQSPEVIAKNFLGLGDGLELEEATFTEQRFGLPGETKTIRGGTIFFEPAPVGKCEIRIKSAARVPQLYLEGDIYGFAPPQMPGNDISVRYSYPPIEIMQIGGRAYLSLNMNNEKKYDLNNYEVYSKVVRIFEAGKFKLTVSQKGRRICSAEYTPKPEAVQGASVWADVLEMLCKITRQSGKSGEICFKPSDLIKNSRQLQNIAVALHHANTWMESEVKLTEGGMHFVLYSLVIDIDEFTLAATVERRVESEQVTGDTRLFRLGGPFIHEAWIRKGVSRQVKESILENMEEIAAEISDDLNVLLIPDLLDRWGKVGEE